MLQADLTNEGENYVKSPPLVKVELSKRNGKRRFRVRIWKFAIVIEYPSSRGFTHP